MNKRHIYHVIKNISRVRTWYFVVAIIIVSIVAVAALRNNNIVALQLRDAVLQADKENADVEAPLKKLREHVYGHMNSDLAVPGGAYPPVQLKYRYDRLVAAEKARTASDPQLYTEAQAYCETVIPVGRSLGRIECIENYLTTNGPAKEQAIPDALYKFNFSPPIWSPDLAGWSLVLAAILVLLLIVRVLSIALLRHLIKHQ